MVVRSTAPKTGTQAIDLTSQRFSFQRVIRHSDRTADPFILSLVFTFFIKTHDKEVMRLQQEIDIAREQKDIAIKRVTYWQIFIATDSISLSIIVQYFTCTWKSFFFSFHSYLWWPRTANRKIRMLKELFFIFYYVLVSSVIIFHFLSTFYFNSKEKWKSSDIKIKRNETKVNWNEIKIKIK